MALQQFYVAYGEFFAVWKLWNRLDRDAPPFEDRRWELHKRAAAAEAIVEGTLVKLSSELLLTSEQINDLGCFRQAFQQLRQSIRKNELLLWISSEDTEYKKFKSLTVRVSAILSGEWIGDSLLPTRAAEQLLAVTSNSHEGKWMN